MKIYYPLTIDLYNIWPLPVMTAQQGNSGRGAAITLVASGQVVQLEGETVTFYVRKPDGTVSFLPATISGTTILCDFTTQMLAKSGTLQVEVLISGGTEEAPESISTPIFKVDVQPSNIDSSAIESQNEFTALQEALAQVSGAVSGADAAAEAATEAAEAAGDAATAANQATQAANTAAGNANDAAGAAGGAATAANQAAQTATTAAGSANSAASAANQAAQAASTAIADLKPIATSGKASDVAIDTISGMTATDAQTALSQLNSKMLPFAQCLITDVVVSAGSLTFTIGIGSYNESDGLYILTGNNNNMNLFTIIFAYAYEVKLIGYATGNIFTNFSFSGTSGGKITIEADEITSDMAFAIRCIKIAPLRG